MNANNYRIWAYRRAAWTVDELPESIAEIYHAGGEAGLRELPRIGKSLAGEIAHWLREEQGAVAGSTTSDGAGLVA